MVGDRGSGRALALSLGLLPLSLSGCASSFCSEPQNESAPMCALNLGGTVAAYSVSPTRVALNKDAMTTITVTAYEKLIGQQAVLKQATSMAKPYAIGNVRSDGTLKVIIQAGELLSAGFEPGPAELEIAGQKLRMRIFVAPKFDSETFSAAYITSNDHGAGNLAGPVWVGVQSGATKKILTLNKYAIATIQKQAIGEYTYEPDNKIVKKATPLLFSAYNATPYMDMTLPGLALSATDFVVAEYGNAATSLLTQCSIDGPCSGSTAVPYGTISSLSTVPAGAFYTGIFNARVVAFEDAKLQNMIPLGGQPASATSAIYSIAYYANEDLQPDLSVWHSDGSVSVAVADGAGRNLTYDAKESESWKTLGVIGNAAPDAVAVSDIDQDGLADFVIVKGASLYILSNEGGGRYTAGPPVPIPTRGPTGSAMLTPVSAIAIGDLSTDTNGWKDLVLVSKNNQGIAVMENQAVLR